MLTKLIKLYNDEKKYEEKLYNILNIKLKIFYNNYNKINLILNQLQNAFSIMLKKWIVEFYYKKLADKNLDFKQIINKMKFYFEMKEN